MRRPCIFETSRFAVLALALGGCMHVPVSTIYKLATFDFLTADPAVIRAAVRYPSAMEVRPGGVVLTVTTGATAGLEKRADTFTLEEAKESTETEPIARYRRNGTTVAAYRLNAADTERVRRLLAGHREALARGERPGAKGIGIAASACHNAGLPAGAILTSTFLRLDAAQGYMAVLEDFDLRSELSAEALAAQVPPCLPR